MPSVNKLKFPNIVRFKLDPEENGPVAETSVNVIGFAWAVADIRKKANATV
jgi:hypothetical protein